MSDRPCYVYVLQAATHFHEQPDLGLFKVGVADILNRRLSQLATACPYRLSIRASLKLPSRADALYAESEAHRWLRNARTNGEWFCETFEAVWHAVACNALCAWANRQDTPSDSINAFMRYAGFPAEEIDDEFDVAITDATYIAMGGWP